MWTGEFDSAGCCDSSVVVILVPMQPLTFSFPSQPPVTGEVVVVVIVVVLVVVSKHPLTFSFPSQPPVTGEVVVVEVVVVVGGIVEVVRTESLFSLILVSHDRCNWSVLFQSLTKLKSQRFCSPIRHWISRMVCVSNIETKYQLHLSPDYYAI